MACHNGWEPPVKQEKDLRLASSLLVNLFQKFVSHTQESVKCHFYYPQIDRRHSGYLVSRNTAAHWRSGSRFFKNPALVSSCFSWEPSGQLCKGALNLTFHYQAVCIQGDSGGICNTLGNDSMCDSQQKSSYEHGPDFERLPSYRLPCNAFTSALRLVAASLKICYEMCQTSTSQGFVHCRSSVTQWWVPACMWC